MGAKKQKAKGINTLGFFILQTSYINIKATHFCAAIIFGELFFND